MKCYENVIRSSLNEDEQIVVKILVASNTTLVKTWFSTSHNILEKQAQLNRSDASSLHFLQGQTGFSSLYETKVNS